MEWGLRLFLSHHSKLHRRRGLVHGDVTSPGNLQRNYYFLSTI